jgi:hypothetical protein
MMTFLSRSAEAALSTVVLLIIWHTSVLIIWHLFVEDLPAIPQASREIALASTIPGRGVCYARWLFKGQFPIEPHCNERIWVIDQA